MKELRSGRAIAIGALGVALLCAVTPYNDLRLQNTFLYGNHLPIGGLCLFAVLALVVNVWLMRRRPRAAFSNGELLLIWIMFTCGAGLASSGLWRYLAPMVVAPAYFADSGRRWLDLFRDAPDWLILTNQPGSPLALWFYHGLPPGQTIPWMAWLRVTAAWGAAFACMAAFSMGTSAILCGHWLRRERLSFPLAQLPMHIVRESGSPRGLIGNRGFWAGVLTVVVCHAISTAHHFVPSVPDLAHRFDISGWQQVPPWSALGLPVLEIYFAVIGAVFLIPADVSLSLWLTYIVLHLVRVLRFSLGYDPLHLGPLSHEGAMGVGAMLVWAPWLLWLARPQARRHWEQDGLCPTAPLWAIAATCGGSAGLLIWMRLAGVPWTLAAIVLGLFALILLVLTRIVAEAGLLFVQTPFIPTDLMAFWGTGYFTRSSAGATLLAQVVLMHDPREHVMPAMANAYAIAGMSRRRLPVTSAILLALLVGFCVSFVSSLWVNYRFGAITLDQYGPSMAPTWSLDRALQYAETPLQVDVGCIQGLTVGSVLAGVLLYLRAHLVAWPLGPIGLVMGSTYAMGRIWFAVFIGWLAKATVIRFGGLPGYRRALPFFLGLLMGEGIFGGGAAIWGMLTGVTAPQFLPN